MGAIEESGKVAVSVVDSLKAQPLAIALILINVMFLAMLVWIIHEVRDGRDLDRRERSEMQAQITKLALECRQQSEKGS